MAQIIKQMTNTVLPIIVASYIIYLLLSGMTINGRSGILHIVGDIPSTEITDSQIHQTPEKLNELLQKEMPKITVEDRVYKTLEEINLHSIFTVIKDEVTYNGTQETEGGFKIVLLNVNEKNNSSVMEKMTMEEFKATEEVYFQIAYDEASDILLFTQAGVYDITIKCILDNGATANFVATIPVETTNVY